MTDIWKLIIFSLTSVVFLFVISKLLGKKQIAQLNFIDYVIGISIGSIAAEMATDMGDTPFYYYLIAMAIFFAIAMLVNFFERKAVFLKNFLKGKPLTVIYDGKIEYKTLKKSNLDINDLLALSREQGYFDFADIAYAVFENSGKLSIMPKGDKTPTVQADLKLPYKQAELPNYLISDGAISYSGLSQINKNEAWLFKKLKIKDKSALKNILLASYNEPKNEFRVHYKA